jgi:hypothetical protein
MEDSVLTFNSIETTTSKQRVFVVPFDNNGVYLMRTDGEMHRLVGEV